MATTTTTEQPCDPRWRLKSPVYVCEYRLESFIDALLPYYSLNHVPQHRLSGAQHKKRSPARVARWLLVNVFAVHIKILLCTAAGMENATRFYFSQLFHKEHDEPLKVKNLTEQT